MLPYINRYGSYRILGSRYSSALFVCRIRQRFPFMFSRRKTMIIVRAVYNIYYYYVVVYTYRRPNRIDKTLSFNRTDAHAVVMMMMDDDHTYDDNINCKFTLYRVISVSGYQNIYENDVKHEIPINNNYYNNIVDRDSRVYFSSAVLVILSTYKY